MYEAASDSIVELGPEIEDALGPQGPGYLTVTGFLGQAPVAAMRREAETLWEAGHFAENFSDVADEHGVLQRVLKDGVFSTELEGGEV